VISTLKRRSRLSLRTAVHKARAAYSNLTSDFSLIVRPLSQVHNRPTTGLLFHNAIWGSSTETNLKMHQVKPP